MYTLMGGRHGIEFILRGLTAGDAEAKKLMLEGEGYAAAKAADAAASAYAYADAAAAYADAAAADAAADAADAAAKAAYAAASAYAYADAAVIIREVPHAGEQEYMTRATRVATGEEKKADRKRERDVSVAVLTVCAIGICVIVAAMWIGGML